MNQPEEKAVLLKNNGLLPFLKDIRRIALFTSEDASHAQGLQESGYEIHNPVFTREELSETMADAAVYVLSHDPAMQERRNIRLLSDVYPRFVLVVKTEMVIDLRPVFELPGAILWLRTENALDEHSFTSLLSGKTTPSGKLMGSWPGLPFGFGLTYTRFAIRTDLVQQKGTTMTLYLTVSNIGSYPGKETVQVYANHTLAGVGKTSLLKPGAVYKMEVSFPMESLASYDEKASCWKLPKGEYILRAGSSAGDLEREAKVILMQDIHAEWNSHFVPYSCRNINFPGVPAYLPETEGEKLPVFVIN